MSNRLFSTVKSNRPKRNVFDLSYESKLSFNMGDLVPILCKEVVPGDKFRVQTENLIRLAPMLAPLMHRVNVYTHYFFVPNRLVHDDWEDFITGGRLGDSNIRMPMADSGATQESIGFNIRDYLTKGSLADYFGLPTFADPSIQPTQGYKFNVLPFRAYSLIYNEYYRDQNLEEPIYWENDQDALSYDIQNCMVMRKRAWEKDYFTSALPFAQRGGDVSLPLGGMADVLYDNPTNRVQIYHSYNDVTSDANPGSASFYSVIPPNQGQKSAIADNSATILNMDPQGTLKADLSNASGATITELRRSLKLQEWLERNARGGARYIEQILQHFGVISSDARLQRPEYLGGGKTPIMISEVLQTSATNDVSPQANMSGHGLSVGSTHSFSKGFEEHGYIIGIMSVLPRTAYQQGVPKHFMKQDRFDYFWPEFAHIGEQEVKNSELFYNPADNLNNETFGYQARYSEYKFSPTTVHGEFKDTLNFWHMGRVFASRPALNKDFVTSNPTHRIFAVEDPSEHKLYCQLYHNIQAIRPMPKFGTPMI